MGMEPGVEGATLETWESDAAASQQFLGKIPHATRRRTLWADQPPWGWQRAPRAHPNVMADPPLRRFVIQGLTREGKPFRPSDWDERLAGVMSTFRPGGSVGGPGAHIGYSPWCVPRIVDGVRSVIVDEAVRALEPMAWDFVTNFARDNELVTLELPAETPTEAEA
jgi:hypothetical protein